MAFAAALAAQPDYFKFREDNWESDICHDCVGCNQQPGTKFEISKKFAFYCGEALIGTWQYTIQKFTSCDSSSYQTKCFEKEGLGEHTFSTEGEALYDICQEVRHYCPGPLKVERIESPENDFFALFFACFLLSKEAFLALANPKEEILLPPSFELDEDISITPPRTDEQFTPPPPIPPPPPLPIEEQVLFKIVEQMPLFPGCEDMEGSFQEKRACADKKMLDFIYARLKHPDEAKKQEIEGTVVVTFVVEKDGSVSDAEIVREIGGGCGEEALRVINLMNEEGIRWIPGEQRGRPVPVQFNLPVKFKL